MHEFFRLTLQGLLIGVLGSGDLPALPERPFGARAPDRRGCPVDTVAPAPAERGGAYPVVPSPLEYGQIAAEALRALFAGDDTDAIHFARSREIRVGWRAAFDGSLLPELSSPDCDVGRWAELIGVGPLTLRLFVRENVDGIVPPGPFVWAGVQRVRHAPRPARGPWPCGPVFAEFSNPGVDRAAGEALIRVTLLQNGSGGAFLVRLRHGDHGWHAASTARISFIDGWCDGTLNPEP